MALRVALCAMWEKLDYAEESADTVWTQEYIHHIIPPLPAPTAKFVSEKTRLPQELKFFVIILFILVFVIPSPLISLYSNLENYVFAHFCQLCSSFVRMKGTIVQVCKNLNATAAQE